MFDRKAFHDGRENAYEFAKDIQHYKLVPMKENGMDNSSDNIVNNSNNNNINNSNNKSMNNSNNRVMLCFAKEL